MLELQKHAAAQRVWSSYTQGVGDSIASFRPTAPGHCTREQILSASGFLGMQLRVLDQECDEFSMHICIVYAAVGQFIVHYPLLNHTDGLL